MGCYATKGGGWSLHVGIAAEGRGASATGARERAICALNDSAAQAALERTRTPAVATAGDFGRGRQLVYRASGGALAADYKLAWIKLRRCAALAAMIAQPALAFALLGA